MKLQRAGTRLVPIVLTVLAVFAGVGWIVSRQQPDSATVVDSVPGETDVFPISIRQPAGPPRIDLGIVDEQGNGVTAACSTCHDTRPANPQNRVAADLDEFHQKLNFAHGSISCLSCHNPDDYDSLRLADGTVVAFTDVMTLCAQCHGPQTKDYLHGAHGGMTGYWDLTRGPRTRNNCVDCHAPHAPQFPHMNPTFKPRDRFLNDNISKGGDHE